MLNRKRISAYFFIYYLAQKASVKFPSFFQSFNGNVTVHFIYK